MNKVKIQSSVIKIAEIFDADVPTLSEKYAVLANMLIISALDKDGKVFGHPSLNCQDAFAVERALIESGGSDNHLSAILQAHAILKWAEILETPDE